MLHCPSGINHMYQYLAFMYQAKFNPMKIVFEKGSASNNIDSMLAKGSSLEFSDTTEGVNMKPFGLTEMLETIKLRREDFLLEGHFGFEGNTPLILAVKADSLPSVRVLLEMGANPQSKNKRYFNTPLMVAASEGNLKMVKFFVEELGVCLQLRNNLGNTACHFAGMAYHQELFEYFLDQGSNIEEKDQQGKTTLMMFCNSEDTVKTLVSRGAYVTATKSGKTAMDMSISKEVRRILKAKAKEELEVSRPKQATPELPTPPTPSPMQNTAIKSKFKSDSKAKEIQTQVVNPPQVVEMDVVDDEVALLYDEMPIEDSDMHHPSTTLTSSPISTQPDARPSEKGASRKRPLEEPSSPTNVPTVPVPPPPSPSSRPSSSQLNNTKSTTTSTIPILPPVSTLIAAQSSNPQQAKKRRKRRSRQEILADVSRQLALKEQRDAISKASSIIPLVTPNLSVPPNLPTVPVPVRPTTPATVNQTSARPSPSTTAAATTITSPPLPVPSPPTTSPLLVPTVLAAAISTPATTTIKATTITSAATSSTEVQQLKQQISQHEQTINLLKETLATKEEELVSELENITGLYQEQQIASNEVIATLFEVETRCQQYEEKIDKVLEEKNALERIIRQYKNDEYEWRAKLLNLEKEKVQLQKKVNLQVDHKEVKQRIRELENLVKELESDAEIMTNRYEKSCKQMVEMLHMTTNKLFQRKMNLRLESLFQAKRKDQLCSKCHHHLKDTASYPCGHVSYCQDCVQVLADSKEELHCVTCQAPVSLFLKLLDSSS